MIQEFQANVEKLFNTMVSVGDTETSDADTLVDILRHRATRPIRISPSPDGVQLTYYNVTIVLAHNLSLMHIIYNSDFHHTLRHIVCAELHRLADFVVALERDIPKWKHIWMSHDLLIREKMLMEQKVRNVMHTLRRQYTKANKVMTAKERDESRIHFYNLRAHQLMLEHDNPFWRNRKTEAEIIEQCLVYHITPPIERWFEEWTAFADECDTFIAERQRKYEEQEQAAQKLRHLVNLKAMKAKVLLSAIECAEGVCITFGHNITVVKGQGGKVACNGFFTVTLYIDSSDVNFEVSYRQMDAALPLFVDSLKRINDLVPDLHNALAEDSITHSPISLAANYSHFFNFYFTAVTIPPTYYISNSAGKRGHPVSHYKAQASNKIVDRMNTVIEEMRRGLAEATM